MGNGRGQTWKLAVVRPSKALCVGGAFLWMAQTRVAAVREMKCGEKKGPVPKWICGGEGLVEAVGDGMLLHLAHSFGIIYHVCQESKIFIQMGPLTFCCG